MVYVILGILVLILSFVVALVSLVYEQRKIEEKKEESESETSGSAQESVPVQHQGQEAPQQFQTTSQILTSFEQMNPNEGIVQNDGFQNKQSMPVDDPVKTHPEILPPFSEEPAAVVAESHQPVSEEGVWWNRIQDSGQEPQKSKEESDEEESIQAIRDELSRLISNKTSPADARDEDVVVGDLNKTRDEDRKQRVLVGEFSLGDVKRSD